MKKSIIIGSILGLILVVTGCFNSGKKVTCTYKYSEEKYSLTENITATIKKDKIVSIKELIISDISKFDEKKKKDHFNSVRNSYAKFESEGINSITEMKDNKISVEVKIDLTNTTEIEIKNYASIYSDFLSETYTVDEYITEMEKAGFKCK